MHSSQAGDHPQQNAGPGVLPLGTSGVTLVPFDNHKRCLPLSRGSEPGSYEDMITHPSVSALGRQSSFDQYCAPLKYQRLLRGWSQQDVADELYQRCAADGHPEVGISAQHVYRWEAGYCKPRPIYRKHLCLLYGLNADQLGLINPQEVQ